MAIEITQEPGAWSNGPDGACKWCPVGTTVELGKEREAVLLAQGKAKPAKKDAK